VTRAFPTIKARRPKKPATENALAGIVMVVLAFFFFSVTSAVAKTMLPTYSVGQMMLIRSLVVLLLLLPFIVHEGPAGFRDIPRPKLQILRGLVSALEVFAFFWAISYLPMADTVTILLAGPLFVTLWSTLFLGEHVGWRRWSAVALGFIGVLIALRPSAATISLPAAIALVCTMLYAFGVLATRSLRGTAAVVLTTTQMAGALIFGALATLLPNGWTTPNWQDFEVLAFLGVPTAIGYVCMNRALKLAPASVIAPYQYTLIIWAAVFGYLMFGDIPPVTTIVGAIIIIGAGLYISWRERALGKHAPPVIDPV
jgi:drug/metabolite transporter (DMT)-like permease